MDEITLYHYWRSSCSWRVRWALIYKKIPHKLIHLDLLKGEQRSEAYLSKNPAGLIPTLAVDGRYYAESLAILEWLEERYPRMPLLPTDPISRMLVRQLSLSIIAGTQPLQNLLVLNYLSSNEETRKETARHFISRGLRTYEQLIEKCSATYSFGGELSFADLALVPQCYNALRYGVDLAEFPLIKGIYKRCLTMDSCLKTAPEVYQPS